MPNTADKIRFFAAANSCGGFVSMFEDIFGGLSRLYIIKGGSGTGKSRMMEDIARAAEARGFAAQRYYCSADHTSLDGVIIPALDCGMIDGTAPHTRDPKYPGAVDEIVNVGAFWDAAELRRNAAEIRALTRHKALLFEGAYDAPAAAGGCRRAVTALRRDSILCEKARAAARRTVAKLRAGDGGGLQTRMLDCIGMRGAYRFDTFAEAASVRYRLAGDHGGAQAFLRELVAAALERDHTVYVALDPLTVSETVEVYLPDAGIAFVRGTDGAEYDGILNTDRFTDPAARRANAKRITELRRHERAAVKCALDLLGDAAKRHFRLEEIYSGAMDFAAKERLTRDLIGEIFG